MIYAKTDAASQNEYLLRYMTPYNPTQSRPRNKEPRKRLTNAYFVRTVKGDRLQVCAATFSSISLIGMNRKISFFQSSALFS